MGQRNKTSKGEVSITNADGQIRLRWRHNGDRYSLNLPSSFTDSKLPRATITAMQIKRDMLRGVFDTTLTKYRESDTVPGHRVEVGPTHTQDVPGPGREDA